MTVDELNQKINSALSLGDLLKAFIPGDVDDRVLAYADAILANNPKLQQLLVEDVFSGEELFRGGGELTFTGADGTTQAIDPVTIAIIQLITTLGPVIREWIKRRRER